MFKPGNLQRFNRPGLPSGHASIDVHYEVRNDPREGVLMHFKVAGRIDGREFVEEFDMHRDLAFNFASLLTKALKKHGFPPNTGPFMRGHLEYDAMFNDIRRKLHAEPGGPVNLDHLD